MTYSPLVYWGDKIYYNLTHVKYKDFFLWIARVMDCINEDVFPCKPEVT